MDDLPVESAGFGVRAASRVIDYVASLVAGVLCGVAVAFLAGAVAGATHKPESEVYEAMNGGTAVTWLGSIIAVVVYHAFAEAVGGSSLGKRVCGLEVVSEALGPATLRQTFIRNVVFFLDSFFFGLIAWNFMDKSPLKQRLGDQWAKTRVVLRKTLPPEQRRDTRIFVFVLLGAIALAAEALLVSHLVSYWLFA